MAYNRFYISGFQSVPKPYQKTTLYDQFDVIDIEILRQHNASKFNMVFTLNSMIQLVRIK